MDIDSSLASFLIAYKIPSIFLGAFFFGETVIVTAAFLAGQGLWSVYEVFLASLIATIISDVVWFYLGEYFLRKTHRWEKFWHHKERIIAKLDDMLGSHHYYHLLYLKFLYGIRIFAIVYLSIKKLPIKTFVIYDTLGTALYQALIIAGGFLAGKGAAHIALYINQLEYGIIAVILLVLGYKLISAWIKKKVIGE